MNQACRPSGWPPALWSRRVIPRSSARKVPDSSSVAIDHLVVHLCPAAVGVQRFASLHGSFPCSQRLDCASVMASNSVDILLLAHRLDTEEGGRRTAPLSGLLALTATRAERRSA